MYVIGNGEDAVDDSSVEDIKILNLSNLAEYIVFLDVCGNMVKICFLYSVSYRAGHKGYRKYFNCLVLILRNSGQKSYNAELVFFIVQDFSYLNKR